MSTEPATLRVIIVGLGVQGEKRRRFAATDCVGTVDPLQPEASFKRLEDVPFDAFDAALVCTPDEAKLDLLSRLLDRRKHVLVEKPLLSQDDAALEGIVELARSRGTVCYTAYNHRFEPHFVRMRELIDSGRLGPVYLVRLFYGNGTAREVRDSAWRDRGAGVLPDLGSHLLDTAHFWFGAPEKRFELVSAHRFENRTYDHVSFRSEGPPVLEMEASLLSWRNHFTADVFAERGSAHIESLCKWGPSTFRLRTRVLPSGRPPEENTTLIQPDPTWQLEYEHFKRLCTAGESVGFENDRWLNRVLNDLQRQALARDAG